MVNRDRRVRRGIARSCRRRARNSRHAGRRTPPLYWCAGRDLLAARFAPDQRRESPALAIAPMRKEPLAVRERAPSSTADVGDTQRVQSAFRETDEIGLPATARILVEERARAGILL